MRRPRFQRIPWVLPVAILALLVCAGPSSIAFQETGQAELATDSQSALRAKILATAERYATFEWTAGEEHVFHGTTANGVRVDTPDVSFDVKGWSPDGRVNRGMPYSWGGFTSIEEFQAGLKKGRYAGNVPASTRARGTSLALGLDCSGFVARAWDLPTKQSTRTLGALCYELPDYEELLPGDILNIANGHVVLFKEWVDEAHSRMRIYESGRLRVEEAEYATAERERRGFVPMRYKPLDARWVPMEFEAITFVHEGGEEGHWSPDPDGVYPELAELKNPLADALPLEWADYEVTDSFPPTPSRLQRTLMVARVEGDRVDTQTVAEIQERKLMTGRSVTRTSPIGDSLIEFMAFEEPLDDVTVVAGSAERGEYVIGDRAFTAHRISAFVETSWNMHGVTRPVTVEIDCVLSDEVSVHGVLEARFSCEIVWEEDDEGNRTVSPRELTFTLTGFGGA